MALQAIAPVSYRFSLLLREHFDRVEVLPRRVHAFGRDRHIEWCSRLEMTAGTLRSRGGVLARGTCLTACYTSCMDKTITIRIDRAQDTALTARARAQGKTRSEVVRELLACGLEEQPLGRRIGHVKGRLRVPSPKTGWQRRIKDRNWR